MSASLAFLGANGTVTGSRYLIESGPHRVLVDCVPEFRDRVEL